MPKASASSLDSFKLPSPEEMAMLDARTIESGVPTLELMERAGTAVAQELLKTENIKEDPDAKVVILAGPGNNGGDGFVIARKLKEAGVETVVILASASRYSEALKVNAKRWQKFGGRSFVFGRDRGPEGLKKVPGLSEADLLQSLTNASVIVDALLGTGQREAPREPITSLIRAVAKARHDTTFLLAVDVPSGINTDTGGCFDPCLSVNLTVAIQLIKRGMLQYPARSACGEICTVGIGIDCSPRVEFSCLTEKHLFKPSRTAWTHKGSMSPVLVIGGSATMPGAPFLAGLAALRSGAGLVNICRPETAPWFGAAPELIYHQIEEGGDGVYDERSIVPVLSLLKDDTVVVLGPGMGQEAVTATFFEAILDEINARGLISVIDADALNLISKEPERFFPKLKMHLLTPHPGEAARLLKLSSAEVQENRIAAAKELHEKTGAALVLKGAASVVYGDGQGFINTTGNPYMATAGSGDVLAGMIAAMVAQGLAPLEALKFAVFWHGFAGDNAYRKDQGPIVASDIICAIPSSFADILE